MTLMQSYSTQLGARGQTITSVTLKFINWANAQGAEDLKINDYCEPVAKSKVSDRAPRQLFSMGGVNFFLLNITCS